MRARARLSARGHRLARRLTRRAPAPLAVPVPEALLRWRREGSAPLGGPPTGVAPGATRGGPLRVAVVIPAFRRGSGGHDTIAHLIRGLEGAGHHCSLWLADDEGRHATQTDADVERCFREFFGATRARLHTGFGRWRGADVVLATGWQTVYHVLGLSGAGARAYLVQDHEPEFYPTSAEAVWAADSYRQGLHCIAASPWLADLLRQRYGARASPFDLGVEHRIYRPGPEPRREDRVLFYARAVTGRRAVPLGLLALSELHARRPEVEIALFGESRPLRAPFTHVDLGVLEPSALAGHYSSATVGLGLSMTNPSRVPTEMLACALACVDLASPSMLACFGADGPIALAAFDPLALADALERLLDRPGERAERARAGQALVASRTWEAAAGQVEEGLREALGRG